MFDKKIFMNSRSSDADIFISERDVALWGLGVAKRDGAWLSGTRRN
jgi:hypothetical protein